MAEVGLVQPSLPACRRPLGWLAALGQARLRGKQPIVMALARGLGAVRLPTAQRKALDDGRLTIVSPFPTTEKHNRGEHVARLVGGGRETGFQHSLEKCRTSGVLADASRRGA